MKSFKNLADKKEVLERFTAPAKGIEFHPPPIFGDMSEAEWMRWGYLHCDHHLRQFGA